MDLQKATTKLKRGNAERCQYRKHRSPTLVSLKTTSDNLAEASKDGSPIDVKMRGDVIARAKKTMTTVNVAADDLHKVLETRRTVMQKATQGDGLIGGVAEQPGDDRESQGAGNQLAPTRRAVLPRYSGGERGQPSPIARQARKH